MGRGMIVHGSLMAVQWFVVMFRGLQIGHCRAVALCIVVVWL